MPIVSASVVVLPAGTASVAAPVAAAVAQATVPSVAGGGSGTAYGAGTYGATTYGG